jgi:hypothetical protein
MKYTIYKTRIVETGEEYYSLNNIFDSYLGLFHLDEASKKWFKPIAQVEVKGGADEELHRLFCANPRPKWTEVDRIEIMAKFGFKRIKGEWIEFYSPDRNSSRVLMRRVPKNQFAKLMKT